MQSAWDTMMGKNQSRKMMLDVMTKPAHPFSIGLTLLLWLAGTWSNIAHAQWDRSNGFEETPYLEFRLIDQRYVERAISSIDALARDKYGSGLKQAAAHDLPLLQRLLDDEVIDREDQFLAQAAGTALGATLAAELDLDWIRYRDEIGVSRALLVPHSDQVIFPVSMISRRYRVGLTPDVHILYKNASELARKARALSPDY